MFPVIYYNRKLKKNNPHPRKKFPFCKETQEEAGTEERSGNLIFPLSANGDGRESALPAVPERVSCRPTHAVS